VRSREGIWALSTPIGHLVARRLFTCMSSVSKLMALAVSAAQSKYQLFSPSRDFVRVSSHAAGVSIRLLARGRRRAKLAPPTERFRQADVEIGLGLPGGCARG